MEKRLYRARNDKILFGLLGGIAKYFDVDPAIVRIAFILICLIQPVFIAGYFLMALVVPEEKVESQEVPENDKEESFAESRAEIGVGQEVDVRTRTLFGALLMGAGIYIILEEYFHFPFGLRELTGILLLALGAYVILKK